MLRWDNSKPWISSREVAELASPWLSCAGNTSVSSPALSRLAHPMLQLEMGSLSLPAQLLCPFGQPRLYLQGHLYCDTQEKCRTCCPEFLSSATSEGGASYPTLMTSAISSSCQRLGGTSGRVYLHQHP